MVRYADTYRASRLFGYTKYPNGGGTMGFFAFLIIGLLAGWIAGMIMRGRGFGLLGNLVVGVVGSFFGAFIFVVLGLIAYTFFASLVMAVVGAVVFLFIINLIRRS